MSLHESEGSAHAVIEVLVLRRMQEYIHVSFYSLYVYYVITTLREEISIMMPHRRNFGRFLFFLIRYGMCTYIALHFTREYRNYRKFTPNSCKALGITQRLAHWSVDLACSLSLGQCLCALLRASWFCYPPIFLLCLTPSLVDIIHSIGNDLRYPAEYTSPLEEALGYPCFLPSEEEWNQAATSLIGADVRAYIYLTTAIILLLVALLVFFIDYRHQKGRLIRVMRRDGGLCYLSVTSVRLLSAILNAPAVASMKKNQRAYQPIFLLLTMANDIVIPILTQRLIINIYKTDSYDSCSSATSALAFAPFQSEVQGSMNSASEASIPFGPLSDSGEGEHRGHL